MIVNITELKPHPLNAEIYTNIDDSDLQKLSDSIKSNGLIQKIKVNPDMIILSGHRRWKALELAGILSTDVEIVHTINEKMFIIESNRYRKKTFSEIMKEAEVLLTEEKQENNPGRANDKVAEITGVGSGVQLFKMKKIWETSKDNENIKQDIERIDKGEASVHSVYDKVKRLEIPKDEFQPKCFNVWNFNEVDPSFGIPHPGRLPGGLVENVIYYFSNEGDIVVDPFAGGGTTLDVCKTMNRICYSYDIAPMRDDIIKHDISKGYPDNILPDLIFLDPPYWNMMKDDYVKESCSSMSLDDFLIFIDKLFKHSYKSLKDGGNIAFVITTQCYLIPEHLFYIDWPFIAYDLMQDAGFIPYTRISCPLPTSQYSGFDSIKAKETKTMMGILRDIIVMKKITED